MESLQTAEPIAVTNTYGVLSNLMESTLSRAEILTEKVAGKINKINIKIRQVVQTLH